MAKKLVSGIGFNDADYQIGGYLNGKQFLCKKYETWRSMLKRCYSEKTHEKRPTYVGCSVCSEWLIFSNFKRWMDEQDWQGKQLDKDILFHGNRVYSPETCVFVDARVNTFAMDRGISSSGGLVGCYKSRCGKLFTATCQNSISGKREFIGRYKNKEDAHLAWRSRKHEIACDLADLESDFRVSEALRKMFR